MSELINRQTGLSENERPPLAERVLFENRISVIIIFALLTAFFGWQALQIEPDASFEKMIPTSHPYIQNYLDNKADLASLGNSIRIIYRRRHLRQGVPGSTPTNQRRGLLYPRRRPFRSAVDLDAKRTLERGNGRRLSWWCCYSERLRWIGRVSQPATAQHSAFRAGWAPRCQ